jgi:hypothetical protein
MLLVANQIAYLDPLGRVFAALKQGHLGQPSIPMVHPHADFVCGPNLVAVHPLR